jgi:adenylate cyclase
MQGLAPSEIFQFEDFRLDRRGGLSRCNAAGAFVPVAIGSRALDILGVLIARAGEVVSKEELIAAVWPGTVVEDSNLTVQISALRRVLDRGLPNGSSIQTVAGRGYRFIAPVTRPSPEVLPASPERDPGSEERQPGLRSALSAAASTRRLAAILAADIAGYSRLMGADEEGTLARLKALRAELIDPAIAEHRGRLVKTTGDGLLVKFQSVVDAVRCAIAWQDAMGERNALEPSEGRIEFRIGINAGDVVIDGDDIYGDGVNIAMRLERIAEQGGICVARTVITQTRGKLDFPVEDLGEQALRNIAQPIHVFRVVAEKKPMVEPPLALPDKPSLAVLPFQNLTGDAEQGYFVDGMVEEITTAIARLPWLFVIARNSAFTYKGKPVDVKQVAQELGVRYVLEGSVRKAGSRVRISGQLIDTTTGAHIWADRFDGALDDIFELQDQVASNVAGAIEPKLRQSEIDRASRKPTANLTAYDLYLRALAQSYRYTDEGLAETVALARKALAIDPSYAPAAAMVGRCRVLQRVQGWGALSDEDIGEACRLARQALEAERDDAETIWQAAWTLFFLAGEGAIAAGALDRALTRNPNAAHAWTARGNIHAVRNQPEAAIEAIERARRLSPFDPYAFAYAGIIAIAHLAARRFEQAIEWADRSLHDQPRMVSAMRLKVAANAHLGRLDEARAELSRVLAIDPKLTIARYREYLHFMAPEVLELYVTGLRLAGLLE